MSTSKLQNVGVFILLLIFISWAVYADESAATIQKATKHAASSDKEIHLAYLQCYALQENDKKQCHQLITQQFNLDREPSSQKYWLYYSYEAERLGFQWFLNSHNKSCAKIDHGVLFNQATNSYDVICADGNKFKMSFSYKDNSWTLLEWLIV
ncbi:MAG: hypothetical protein COA94_03235 [Rickettsiales bacterium]|nr:MAG: hypothetical protein COA94_03235 [Rickettsiales bacterium]